MSKPDLQYWTCICGKRHVINDSTIFCSGPGHQVQINPRYWTYNPEIKKIEVGQQKLF